MAVAVKNEKKLAQARSENALAVSSLFGATYVVASLALLFYAFAPHLVVVCHAARWLVPTSRGFLRSIGRCSLCFWWPLAAGLRS